MADVINMLCSNKYLGYQDGSLTYDSFVDYVILTLLHSLNGQNWSFGHSECKRVKHKLKGPRKHYTNMQN